jgi:hypothetical protein
MNTCDTQRERALDESAARLRSVLVIRASAFGNFQLSLKTRIYNEYEEFIKELIYGGFERCRNHLGVPDAGREISRKPFGIDRSATGSRRGP